MKKVALHNLGCKVNSYELDAIQQMLQDKGYKIVPFDETQKELWLKFPTKEAFLEKESQLNRLLFDSDGNDEVIIYIENPKAIKRLGRNQTVLANPALLGSLYDFLGENNVKLVEKNIENTQI